MSYGQIVVWALAIPLTLIAAALIWGEVAAELRKLRGDVTTEVWMRTSDPRRSLVPVVDRDGRYIAVRPDKTEGWDR